LFGKDRFIDYQLVMIAKQIFPVRCLLKIQMFSLPININQMQYPEFLWGDLNKLLTKKTLNYIWWIKI